MSAPVTPCFAAPAVGGARRRRRPGRSVLRGLSLVEMMVALAITASLLTAAAVAFNASSNVVEANDEFFRASQAGRISLHQMLTQVRRANSINATDAHNLNLTTVADDGGPGEAYSYRYLPASRQLVLVVGGANYTLANNVSALTFVPEEERLDNLVYVNVRVNVTMTVNVGENVVTLSGSAANRRNLKY